MPHTKLASRSEAEIPTRRESLPPDPIHTAAPEKHADSHYAGSGVPASVLSPGTSVLTSQLNTQNAALRTSPSPDLLSLTPTEWLEAVEDPDTLRRYMLMTLCNGVIDKFYDLMESKATLPAYRLSYPKLKNAQHNEGAA